MEAYLDEGQIRAVKRLRRGKILCGGTGSGKSRTALAYYYLQMGGWEQSLYANSDYHPMENPIPLYIITPAHKRDLHDWDEEMWPLFIKGTVDSWNNIQKYKDVKGAFFIFDEQRVSGKGAWVKAFLEISKHNHWILCSATPGDNWLDYAPVFIANGYFKNLTDFKRQHVMERWMRNHPEILGYINEGRLNQLRYGLLVDIDVDRHTEKHFSDIWTKYDLQLYQNVRRNRWDVYKEIPIRDAAGLCYVLRKVVNSAEERQAVVMELVEQNPKCIIFYSYDYELEILKSLKYPEGTVIAELNGKQHDPLPESERWVYLVNYKSGAEAWNCITTNVIIFYSQQYSWKVFEQCVGRIDRRNTPFKDLYYYELKSKAPIDLAISRALKKKKTFSEKRWAGDIFG